MSIEFFKSDIEGLLVIQTHVAEDRRGFYRKNYEKYVFAENGYYFEFNEWSDIYSNKGVIRGLHFQTECSQAKLIHVITGAIYDVAVDLRRNSKTFGKWHGELLKQHDHKALFIPEGFAHGFLALEDNTIFSYQCTGKYIPEACGGIIYNDKDLDITWPVDNIEHIILSDKDNMAMTFKEYCSKY